MVYQAEIHKGECEKEEEDVEGGRGREKKDLIVTRRIGKGTLRRDWSTLTMETPFL